MIRAEMDLVLAFMRRVLAVVFAANRQMLETPAPLGYDDKVWAAPRVTD